MSRQRGADTLLVETAGLCLRCAPYIEGSLGIVVLEATSGMNLPRKIGAMLTLADIAVLFFPATHAHVAVAPLWFGQRACQA